MATRHFYGRCELRQRGFQQQCQYATLSDKKFCPSDDNELIRDARPVGLSRAYHVDSFCMRLIFWINEFKEQTNFASLCFNIRWNFHYSRIHTLTDNSAVVVNKAFQYGDVQQCHHRTNLPVNMIHSAALYFNAYCMHGQDTDQESRAMSNKPV